MGALSLLAIAIVFGGASREHALRLALVEVAALPILAMALLKGKTLLAPSRDRFAWILCAILIAIPAIQVIPLPGSVWLGLPGRDQLRLALEIAGIEPGWGSISLTPDLTWSAALALIPPLAMFAIVVGGDERVARSVAWAFVVLTALAIVLGAAQIVSGGVRLYPWSTTAAGNVVGFFANRNHMATMVLASMPFAAALGSASAARTGRTTSVWVAGAYLILSIVVIGAIRSRVGLALAAPVLAGSILIGWMALGRRRPGLTILVGLASAVTAIGLVAALALGPVLARFDRQGVAEGRFESWPIIADVTQTYLPLGSGIGSFDVVYRSVEPLELLDSTFLNHAHNEYLEIWLESGWFGVAAVVAFLAWFLRRGWTAWVGRATMLRSLQRAATVAVLTVLLHSIFDYPLRTATIAVIFAFCCGLLALPSIEGEGRERRRRVI